MPKTLIKVKKLTAAMKPLYIELMIKGMNLTAARTSILIESVNKTSLRYVSMHVDRRYNGTNRGTAILTSWIKLQ